MPAQPEVRPPKAFPHCLVWTPIPIVTWLLPFVGHMGVCSAAGTIHDFAGPYFVNRGELSFGSPTRYLQLDPGHMAGDWDVALAAATAEYEHRMYNFFLDNCHCYVARFLNEAGYEGRRDWNMVQLAARMLFRGRHVGFGGILRTWLPFCVILGVLAIMAGVLGGTA